jgi:hypothetical protein
MGKLVTKNVTAPRSPSIDDYGEGRTVFPLYDKETELHPVPMVQKRDQLVVNYNWALAKTEGLVRGKLLTKTEVFDILIKADRIFKAAYLRIYGTTPTLPAFKARDVK